MIGEGLTPLDSFIAICTGSDIRRMEGKLVGSAGG